MICFKNDKPLSYEELLKIENEIYNSEVINFEEKENVNISQVMNRKVETFEDKTYNLPQHIFFLKNYNGEIIFGRKIRSVLSFENKINALHCSMITASMIMGILKSNRKEGKSIKIEYYPFTKGEKKAVFDEIKKDRNIDIYYPYNFLFFDTDQEECTSPEGWDLNPEKVIYLGYGEEHIRKYTIKYLKENKLICKGAIIYDPACSTGQFLNTLKMKFPFIKTIGQDLSKEMVDYAKNYVDEIYCGDSINSPLENESVDIMFLRFLNSEVVTTEYAYKLFENLYKKVKRNGYIIIFGHTSVLIKCEDFEKYGLQVLEKNAYDVERDAIFQYYILRRC